MKLRLLVVFFVVAVFAIAALGLWSTTKRGSPPVPAPQPTLLPTVNRDFLWKGVEPGKTTQDNLVVLAGPPASVSATPEGTDLSYPSQNPYWQNKVQVQNGVVVFVREYVFPPGDRSLQKRLAALGEAPTRLFGPDVASEIYLFVFPDKGIAFVANDQKDVVYEAWHFPATTLEKFLSLPEARGYSLGRRRGPDI